LEFQTIADWAILEGMDSVTTLLDEFDKCIAIRAKQALRLAIDPQSRWRASCSRQLRAGMSPPKSFGSRPERWKEVPAELRHSGAVGNYDVTELSREELMRIAASGD
jgi:hypothetical protein